jgi:tripartite-type tricarboxylate transporter receptor subunit TctC
VAKVFADLHWALQAPDVLKKLGEQGWDVVGSSPGEFALVLQSESARWSAVIKNAKMKPQN